MVLVRGPGRLSSTQRLGLIIASQRVAQSSACAQSSGFDAGFDAEFEVGYEVKPLGTALGALVGEDAALLHERLSSYDNEKPRDCVCGRAWVCGMGTDL
mmetsp:Transcript_21775/g.49314  ORF Transcript_21775/g.49314 Transcript_21775/m.49314 type:complete len:99 (-) Transcript_21775:644-940(-)